MTKRRTKGDGGLYQRKDGLWVGVVELPPADGERKRRTITAKDRNKAIAKLKKLRADVDEGRIAVTSNTTVELWMERWLKDIHGTELRPTTFRDYSSVIRHHINPHIGKKRLDKLTPTDVRHMINSVDSSRNAQKAYVILRRALKDAIPEGMLSRNVAEAVHKPKHSGVEREPLTAPEAKQLLRACRDQEDPMYTRWAAAFLLGGRQGEILGLQWPRLNLEIGEADFSWQLQQLQQVHGCGERRIDETWPCGRTRPGWCPDRKWDLPRGFEHKILHRSLGLTRPKSKAGWRVVPIPSLLWAALATHPQGNNPHGLVWHHPDGRPISPRDDYRSWQKALKLSCLIAEDDHETRIPLHIARHTTATLLQEAGVPEEVRMQILGHSSATVQRGYAHGARTLARDAVTHLDDLLA